MDSTSDRSVFLSYDHRSHVKMWLRQGYCCEFDVTSLAMYYILSLKRKGNRAVIQDREGPQKPDLSGTLILDF